VFFNHFFEAEPSAAILIAHGTDGLSQKCLAGMGQWLTAEKRFGGGG